MNLRRALALVPLLAFAVAACRPANSTPAVTAVDLEVKEFAFTPASLEVTAGQPVKLALHNAGLLDHDFSIVEFPLEGAAEESGGMEHAMGHGADAPELHIAVAAGQTGTLTFTPAQSGTYEFWCTVSGHKDAGMTGTLVVRAP